VTDDFTRELERQWALPAGSDLARVDWGAIGFDVTAGPTVADLAELDPQLYEALALLEPPAPHPWRQTALPHQLEAAEATEPYVLMCAGRGAGKTYTASHTLVEWIEQEPGDYAIIAPTFGDAIKICADGPSGFLKAAGDRVESFNKNEFVIYMVNGSRVVLASADAPDRVRGWNLTGFWADELASWKRAEVWDEGLEFATRIGRTRRIITTTPKRGSKVLKDLLKRAESGDRDVKLVRASTSANAANLSETFLRTIQQRYAGTTLGRQELDGILLGDVEGALVTGAQIERGRVRPEDVPELWRLVVGVDPAVTNTSESDETGIIVAGIGPAPEGWQPAPGQLVLAGAPHIYLLEDCSRRMSVDTWGRQALITSDEWAADAIIAEKNQGYDLVESNIRTQGAMSRLSIPNIISVHAARGKFTRAEPVGALFEQDRVHIVNTMPTLEDQWTEWIPGDGTVSPDRLDASVWAVVGLMPELGIGGSGAVEILSAG
jgi:phage terminase large subunit-like protein